MQQYQVSVEQFTFDQTNSESFLAEANKILDFQPDGVIFPPFFLKESNFFIKKLKENSIPFVFIDSVIKDAGHLSYIGQDSFQSGLLSGKLLDILTPKDSNILIIHFAKEMDNQNHLVQREKGFYKWYENKNNHRLKTLEISHAESNEWHESIVQGINKNKVSGIFVTNSKVFYIGRLVESLGLKNLNIIGHDLLNENINFLKHGIVQFLICQRPEDQGYNAINKLFRNVVQKRDVAKMNYTSIDIVTKENVDYYKAFK